MRIVRFVCYMTLCHLYFLAKGNTSRIIQFITYGVSSIRNNLFNSKLDIFNKIHQVNRPRRNIRELLKLTWHKRKHRRHDSDRSRRNPLVFSILQNHRLRHDTCFYRFYDIIRRFGWLLIFRINIVMYMYVSGALGVRNRPIKRYIRNFMKMTSWPGTPDISIEASGDSRQPPRFLGWKVYIRAPRS